MLTPDSKVLLLPEEHSAYRIVRLPDGAGAESSYILAGNSVYELKSLATSGPKSFIFEGEPGYVRQSNELIVASKFSIVFLLISALFSNENYITSETLIDTNEWMAQLPAEMVEEQLARICDTIVENGEDFYRIAKEKTLKLLSDKIERLKNHLKTSSLVNQVKVDLYTSSEEEISAGILDAELRRIALDMVQSYLTVQLDKELVEYNGWDFAALEEHKKSVQRQLVVQEQQMMQDSGKSKSTKATVKAKVKTKAKKVAVGKGALDSFFKRKVA